MVRSVAALFVAFVIVGCGSSAGVDARMVAGTALAKSSEFSADANFDGAMPSNEVAPIDSLVRSVPVTAEAQPAVAGRKIIYNANVRIVVKDLQDFLNTVRQVISDQNGFIGSSSESGMDGENPSARLTIRVPSIGYQPILIELAHLGTVEQRSETTRDVTAEFVDVEARIRNKEREESRLIELLAETSGKLSDVLDVERELSRVRGEIERAQGQMNVLRDQIDLATITIEASERTVYTPPTQASFGDRVGAAWEIR